MKGDPRYAVGPGHNSLVLGPNNADLYMAYHAWPPEMTERRPCLIVSTGTAMSYGLPHPRMSRSRRRRCRACVTSSPARQWTPPGRRVPGAGGRQGAPWPRRRPAAGETPPGARHRAWPCLAAGGPDAPRRRRGRIRRGAGRRSPGARLLLDPAAGRLEARLPGAGPATASLPLGFRPDAWHQLLIAQAGARLTVRLDGVPCLDTVAASISGGFALYTAGCRAEFAAVALTDHFRDEFLAAHPDLEQLGWRAAAGEPPAPGWQIVDGGALRQRVPSGEQLILKGAALGRFECGVTVRIQNDLAGPHPGAGLLLRRQDGAALAVILVLPAASWQVLAEGRGALSQARAACERPQGFYSAGLAHAAPGAARNGFADLRGRAGDAVGGHACGRGRAGAAHTRKHRRLHRRLADRAPVAPAAPGKLRYRPGGCGTGDRVIGPGGAACHYHRHRSVAW